MSEHGGTGPLDRQTLRLLQRRALEHETVAGASLEPDPHAPRLLAVRFEPDRYPDTVSSARIGVRWFESGGFGFHYVESGPGHDWECRWDRHENPHAGRRHFHDPPDASTVRDLNVDTHPLSILFTVLAAVENRMAALWDDGADI